MIDLKNQRRDSPTLKLFYPKSLTDTFALKNSALLKEKNVTVEPGKSQHKQTNVEEIRKLLDIFSLGKYFFNVMASGGLYSLIYITIHIPIN